MKNLKERVKRLEETNIWPNSIVEDTNNIGSSFPWYPEDIDMTEESVFKEHTPLPGEDIAHAQQPDYISPGELEKTGNNAPSSFYDSAVGINQSGRHA